MSAESNNGNGYGVTATDGGMGRGPEPGAEGLTLRDYLNVLWRRKWIIVVVVAVATASAYYFSARQPAVYQASADLIYEKQVDLANPLTGMSYNDPNERSAQLSAVSSIIASPDMQQRAEAQLTVTPEEGAGFSVSAETVSTDNTANSTYSSSVVRITASSGSPEMSAAAANAYALAFVDYRKEIVRTQIQRAIDAINTRMGTYPEGARESTDYLVLQQRLRDLQLSRDTATGNFRVLVPATAPAAPVSPKPMRSAILGFGVGLFAAIGLAFLLEQFDTRIRKPEDVAAVLHQPMLGRIPRISHKLVAEGGVVSLRHPGGDVAEAFRMIRTNFDFMAVDGSIRSLLITSCVQGEGKSVAASNLAVTMAIAGKKVVLVDCDLRRPRQHQYFDIPNEAGVSTVVSGQHKLFDALVPIEVAHAAGGAAEAGTPTFTAWAEGADARSRMYVMPSGPIPPNPGEIVASARLNALLDRLTKEADIVIVDTPAMLPVGDTSAIAPKVDSLLFLVDTEVVKRPQLAIAADQLARLPIRILGTVIRVAHHGGQYYYRSRYGSYGYASSYSSYSQNGKGGRGVFGKKDKGAAAQAPDLVATPGAQKSAKPSVVKVPAAVAVPVAAGAVATAADEDESVPAPAAATAAPADAAEPLLDTDTDDAVSGMDEAAGLALPAPLIAAVSPPEYVPPAPPLTPPQAPL